MRSLIVFLFSLFPQFLFAQPDNDTRRVLDHVSLTETKRHITFLSSDSMRGRDTGSPELRVCADYIADYFEKNGVSMVEGHDSYFQNVGLTRIKPPARSYITIDSLRFEHGGDMLVLEGENNRIKADYIFAGYGLQGDYDGIDVRNKIAIIRSGAPDNSDAGSLFGLRQDKIRLARTRGAVGIIELFNSVRFPWPAIVNYLNKESITLEDSENEKNSFPFLWVNDPKNHYKTILSENPGEVEINIEGPENNRVSDVNVLGYIEGTHEQLKSEYIIITAHYDHVGVGSMVNGDSIYNGARDNAIGTVALMNAASFFAQNPAYRSVIFMAVTAEEKGLLGSNWYTQYPLVPLEHTVFNLNTDGAGYNDKSIISVIGLGRTTIDQTLSKAVRESDLDVGGDPAPEQNLFDRSDNVNFAKKGVPCVTFSPGINAFDQEVLKYYHQPADESETIDYEYIEKFNEAFVLTAFRIADMQETPYWIENDKYESAAMKLYGRD